MTEVPQLGRFGLQDSAGVSVSASLYRLAFVTGCHARRFFRRIRRGGEAVFDVALAELAARLLSAARTGSDFLRSSAGRGELSATRSLLRAGSSAAELLRGCRGALAQGGLRGGAPVCARLLAGAAGRFFVGRRAALNYLAPALALAVLAGTVAFWRSAGFGIAVSYGGKPLGVVGSEQTYRDAVAMVESNVSHASGGDFRLSETPSFRFVLADRGALSGENQLYNRMVALSCGQVKMGYGLYVDGRLAGANADSGVLEAMLASLKAPYRNAAGVQSVAFLQDVSIKNGVFPASVFKTADGLKTAVTSGEGAGAASSRVEVDPLFAMNLTDGASLGLPEASGVGAQPTLSVKVVKNEIVNRAIPFGVKQKPSAGLKAGTTRVSVAGKNGTQRVVQAVTYIDGQVSDVDVLSSSVVAQPVVQTVLVGTKQPDKADSSSGSAKKSRRSGSSDSSADSSGGSSSSGGGDSSGGSYDSGASGSAISLAQGALGVPYVSGGSSFSGFDCSGFTSYVYSRLGVYLPHSAAEQSAYGSYVSRSSLRAGDLVFFDTNGGHNNITHVGIYVGGGSFIDASSSRIHMVKVDSLDSAYYASRYMTARRVAH